MSEIQPGTTQIGRYTIERLLARGGMAEVFLGAAQGPGGFAKKLVIKRILPELADDPKFVQMFLDEARLAALLNHPNIVQVFDFGHDQGSYFIAMEYIQGDSVRNALRHHINRKLPFPLHMAVQLIMGACEGLHYAHSLCDENGASYNVVHRDVSPENILVSSNGMAKIVDFGIAKAASQTTRTEAGNVKGKYSYMAPEQILGEGVDRRTDVYALGVTLYELLAGRRPFEGENELALLRTVLEGTPAPLEQYRPDVPPLLASVVRTAMARDRDLRYQDAHAFQQALDEFTASTGKRTMSVEMAAMVDDVVRARRGNAVLAQNISSGPKAVPGFPMAGASIPSRHAPTVVHPGPIDVDLSSARDAEAPAKPRRSLTVPIAVALATVAVLVAAVVLFTRKPPEQLPVADARPIVPPAVAAAPPVAPVPPPAPPVAAPIAPPSVAAPPAAAVAAPPVAIAEAPALVQPEKRAGGKTKRRGAGVMEAPAATPTPVIASAKPAGAAGLLTVRSDPWCDVYVDGKKVGTTPLARLSVDAGKRVVTLRNDGAGAYKRIELEVPANAEHKETVVFPKGSLSVAVTPWAFVSVNGTAMGKTPVGPLPLVEGTHEVRLVNTQLGRDEKVKIRIRANGEESVSRDWQ